jgi:hypothetical protein
MAPANRPSRLDIERQYAPDPPRVVRILVALLTRRAQAAPPADAAREGRDGC